MSEISCRVFEFFETGADLYGYSLDELVADTNIPLEVFLDHSNRVPWSAWTRLCEKFEELVGGPAETSRAGQRIIAMDFSIGMRTMAGIMVSPHLVYVAVARWLGPYFFRGLEWQVERPENGRVVLTITVPEPASAAWFHMAEGAFVCVPEAVNSPPADVSVQVNGRTAVFDIHCATTTTLWARMLARFRSAVSATSLLEEFSVMQTDLRKALSEANSSRQELQLALQAVPDPVGILRKEKLIWSNSAWQEALGDDVPRTLLDSLDLISVDGSQEFTSVDNRTYEVVPPVRVVHEGRPGVLLLLRDVTQTRQAAEKMMFTDRLASLGTLAASVGHEINNPLQVAMGSLELASFGKDVSDPGTRDHLDNAADAIERAAAITSDLLQMGREDVEDEQIRIEAVIKAALRLAGNNLRHIADIQLELEDDLPIVNGSSGRLIQVIVNLLVNASHAMRDIDRQHQIVIRALVENNMLKVSVSDTGPGIPPEIISRVREPFFTTKGTEGSGLGLAICEQIIRDHKGSLEIDSTHEGTTIGLLLPINRIESDVKELPSQEDPEDHTIGRVMIIDDEQSVTDLLRVLLRPHDVVVCPDGATALKNIKDGPTVNAILLDVMLLDQSGLEVMQQLPEELRDRVIFMTGGIFQTDLRGSISELPNPVLNKPFTRAAVMDALDEVFVAAD